MQVNFSSNPHGKLFPAFFQDVRLRDEEKYLLGNVHEIILNRKLLGVAKVVAVRSFRFSNLNDTFSFMNCGKHAAYQAAMLEKFYVHETKMEADTPLVQVVWHWEEREMELFEFLLKEWWQKIVDAQPNKLPFKTGSE